MEAGIPFETFIDQAEEAIRQGKDWEAYLTLIGTGTVKYLLAEAQRIQGSFENLFPDDEPTSGSTSYITQLLQDSQRQICGSA